MCCGVNQWNASVFPALTTDGAATASSQEGQGVRAVLGCAMLGLQVTAVPCRTPRTWLDEAVADPMVTFPVWDEADIAQERWNVRRRDT